MMPPRIESGTPVKKFTPMSWSVCTNRSLSIMNQASLDGTARGVRAQEAHYSQGVSHSQGCGPRVAVASATVVACRRRLLADHDLCRFDMVACPRRELRLVSRSEEHT